MVGEKWPDAGRGVERLLGHFYDHIPAPPEDLFRWIETPHDGRVELWQEIPAGRFLMGSPPEEEGRYKDEGPQHEVLVQSPFKMAAVPVTVAQYRAFEPDYRPYHQDKVPDDDLSMHPAETITWYQAFAFCRWLSASLPWARGVRLPTEEEWEYACRAGTQSRFWSGDMEADVDRVDWYSKNSGGRTHRVGKKEANPWGLYDLHGNVWEWTLSEWSKDYAGRESGVVVDPAAESAEPAALAAASGAVRVFRGGSYWNEIRNLRSAYRNESDPGDVNPGLGFRLCLPCRPEPAIDL